MKFYKYKQLARINCIGFDDELLNNQSSYYNTPYKYAISQEINTKLLRFRFKGLNNIQIGKHAFVPIVLENNFDPKVRGSFQVRLKNLSSDKTFDSSLDNHGSSILFSHSVEQNIQIFLATDTTGGVTFKTETDASGNKLVETDASGNHTVNYQTELENFATTKNGFSFFNNSPKFLYNFDIPNQNFLNQNVLEFELIYYVKNGSVFSLNLDLHFCF